jgi:predicted N-formylglutamate amidohydrolase
MSVRDDLRAMQRTLEDVLVEVRNDPTSRTVAEMRKWKKRLNGVVKYDHRTADEFDLYEKCYRLLTEIEKIVRHASNNS